MLIINYEPYVVPSWSCVGFFFFPTFCFDKIEMSRQLELRAMINSDRTYEEMLAFLENGKKKEEIKNGNKADGRRSRKIKRDDRR